MGSYCDTDYAVMRQYWCHENNLQRIFKNNEINFMHYQGA